MWRRSSRRSLLRASRESFVSSCEDLCWPSFVVAKEVVALLLGVLGIRHGAKEIRAVLEAWFWR